MLSKKYFDGRQVQTAQEQELNVIKKCLSLCVKYGCTGYLKLITSPCFYSKIFYINLYVSSSALSLSVAIKITLKINMLVLDVQIQQPHQ